MAISQKKLALTTRPSCPLIEIGLSDKTHHEQTEDLQEWVNTYAWAATDDNTSNKEKKQPEEAEESELDDDSKADS